MEGAQVIQFVRPEQEEKPVRTFEDRLRDVLDSARGLIDTQPVGGIFLVLVDDTGHTIMRDHIVFQERRP